MSPCLGHVKDKVATGVRGDLSRKLANLKGYVLQQSADCITSSCLLYNAEFSIQQICDLVIRFLLLFLIIPAREESTEEMIMVLTWANGASSSSKVWFEFNIKINHHDLSNTGMVNLNLNTLEHDRPYNNVVCQNS